jgi:hypothetical protein
MKQEELVQWLAFQDLNKTLPFLFVSGTMTRALGAISYFAIIGGYVSERNILPLMKYCGLDMNDSGHMDMIRNMLAFYSAAGIIEILDNNLGMEQMINDPELPYYRKGLVADTDMHAEKLSSMKKELIERADFGREKNER